jgi:hypothetical protein
MAVMMRRTHGFRTNVVTSAAGGLIVLGLFAAGGCTPEERTTTARSAAQVAAASVTTTAAGQSTATTASRRSSGIKVDGRGGFDASEAQQNVLKRAKYAQEHNNDVIKPYLPSTRPSSQPAIGH